jgi:hypothetical protein
MIALRIPALQYVLRALSVDEDLAHSSIRFGIGRFTTEAEVPFLLVNSRTHSSCVSLIVACACFHVYTYVRMCVCAYTCTKTHMYSYICTCIHVHTNAYTSMCFLYPCITRTLPYNSKMSISPTSSYFSRETRELAQRRRLFVLTVAAPTDIPKP